MTYQHELEGRRREILVGDSPRGDYRPQWIVGMVLGALTLLTLGALILTYPGERPDRVRTTENMQWTEQVPSTSEAPQREPN
jgi:hypothetical protein